MSKFEQPLKMIANKSAGLAAILLIMGYGSIDSYAAKSEKPNILLIAVDDLNDWIGVLNGHLKASTPNIDRLAKRGTVFTNFHAASPLCGPTRTAILSGLRPSTTGVYGHFNYNDFQKNPYLKDVVLMPQYFANNGYKTMSTGKIFHEGSPKEAFQIVGDERHEWGPKPLKPLAYNPTKGKGTQTDWGAFPEKDEEMPDWKYAKWAAGQLMKRHDQPFLLSVGFVRPHVPLYAPQKWFDLHPLETLRLPPFKDDDFDDIPVTGRNISELPQMPQMDWRKHEQRWEKSVQAYLACCSFVDHCIGIVLDAPDKSGYADNTIIVMFGDHGYQLGEKGIWAKHTLWERACRTPLIISRPEDRTSYRTNKPTNHMDLYPTLLDLAKLPRYKENEGKSLFPLLDNPDSKGFEASLTTFGYGNHTIRTERWRYIRYEDGSEELYDHWVDRNEWNNLADAGQYQKIKNQLRKFLPKTNAPSDPNSKQGIDYNPHLLNLYKRTRVK